MPVAGEVSTALEHFVGWLDRYGEKSWDHQSFFAGPLGRRAKGLYYKNKILGTAAVAPMIFCEAFFPPARRLFHEPMRLPIADAHYAMGFAFLHEATGEPKYLDQRGPFPGCAESVAQSRLQKFLLGLSLRLGHAQRCAPSAHALHHHHAVCF